MIIWYQQVGKRQISSVFNPDWELITVKAWIDFVCFFRRVGAGGLSYFLFFYIWLETMIIAGWNPSNLKCFTSIFRKRISSSLALSSTSPFRIIVSAEKRNKIGYYDKKCEWGSIREFDVVSVVGQSGCRHDHQSLLQPKGTFYRSSRRPPCNLLFRQKTIWDA